MASAVARVATIAFQGIEAVAVDVQAHISGGSHTKDGRGAI